MPQAKDREKESRGSASGHDDEQRSIDNRGDARDDGFAGRYQGSSGRSREDEDLKSISSQADNSEKDLNALQEEEITGSETEDIRSANLSDTDEDEDEGLGDGNLGRAREGLEK
jgi:hypothetical protein